MEIWIRVKTKEQLTAILESQVKTDHLILDTAVFQETVCARTSDDLGQIPGLSMQTIRTMAVAKIYLQFPDVLRQNRKEQIEKLLERAKDCDGLVIKNLDELGLVLKQQAQKQYTIIGDAFLYAYNKDAIRFYRELIPEMKFIYSDELTDKEAKELTDDKRIFLYKIYGYQPVMITAQCFRKNNGTCGKQDLTELRDETKNNLFAENICDLCHTVIYNGVPTSMLDKISNEYENLLYDFTIEDADTVKKVFSTKPCSVYTRGHHLSPVD